MLFIFCDVLLIAVTIFLIINQGIWALTIGLAICCVLVTLFVYIYRKSIKKSNEEFVQRFRNKLDEQVNATLSKRVAIELQRAESTSNDKKNALVAIAKSQKSPEFDTSSSIANGGDMLSQISLIASRYSNELYKDKNGKCIL